MAFQRQNFGKASTVAWLLFLIIVLFGVVNCLISRRIATSGMPPEQSSGCTSQRLPAAP